MRLLVLFMFWVLVLLGLFWEDISLVPFLDLLYTGSRDLLGDI